MEIYETVSHVEHPNFAELVCHFNCEDNILLYNRQSSLPTGFCHCQGGSNKIHITIMPYYRLGNIEDHPFDQTSLFSIIGQVIMASIEMFDEIGLVHNDLIPGNVVVEHDRHRFMEYTHNGDRYRIKLYGLRAIILDFGASAISRDDEYLVVRDLLIFINRLFRVKYLEPIEQFMDPKKPVKTFQQMIELSLQLNFVERVLI